MARVVLPFGGSGTALHDLKASGVDVHHIDPIEYSKEKMDQLTANAAKIYPHASITPYHDVTDQENTWRKIAGDKEHGPVDMVYGTPSCVTNTGAGQFMRKDKPNFPLSEKEVDAIASSKLRGYIKEYGKSGDTFVGMLEGIEKILQEFPGAKVITEHGYIQLKPLRKAYGKELHNVAGGTEELMRLEGGLLHPGARTRFYFNNSMTAEQAQELADIMNEFANSEYYVTPEDIFKYANEEGVHGLSDIYDLREADPNKGEYNEFSLTKRGAPLKYNDAVTSFTDMKTGLPDKNRRSQISQLVNGVMIGPMALTRDKKGPLIARPGEYIDRYGVGSTELRRLANPELKNAKAPGYIGNNRLSDYVPVNGKTRLSARALTIPEMALWLGKDPDIFKSEIKNMTPKQWVLYRNMIRRAIGDSEAQRLRKLMIMYAMAPGYRATPELIHRMFNGGLV